MRRRLLLGLALLGLMGCQAIEDREALHPLPPDAGQKTSYTDLLLRARKQADLAVNRAYSDIWIEVEEVAKSLEQTAKLLPASPEAPAKKEDVQKLSAAIGADAKKLADAARMIVNLTGAAKDTKQKEIDTLLRNISRNVRTLRAAN
jgi:hypothetical protein